MRRGKLATTVVRAAQKGDDETKVERTAVWRDLKNKVDEFGKGKGYTAEQIAGIKTTLDRFSIDELQKLSYETLEYALGYDVEDPRERRVLVAKIKTACQVSAPAASSSQ
eukprot:4605367-Amphidinium_carterae.1